MPTPETVYRWLRTNDEFRRRYESARADGSDAMTDEILDIADDGRNDFMEKENGDIVLNGEAIQRSRLRVEARKWLASKLKAKKYGDKVQQEVTGPEGGPIQQITREMTPEEASRIYMERVRGDGK